MTYRIDVFKTTQDDWCGSYQMDNQMLVQVSFCGNISPPGDSPTWRVCVWGNDDMGMEFDCDNETQAHTLFLQVIGLEFVNFKELRNLGFVSA